MTTTPQQLVQPRRTRNLRRHSGAPGGYASQLSGEIFGNEADAGGLTLYWGAGDDGTGNSTSQTPVAGPGAFTSLALNLTRAGIASTKIPSFVLRFRTIDSEAPYVRGTSSGPYAIQDALGAWWNIDLSLGVVQAEWFGADPTGTNPSDVAIQAAGNALAATAISAAKVLRFGPGRFLFNNLANITVPTGQQAGYLYNGLTIEGAGQYATKFIAAPGNASGLIAVNLYAASSVVRMRRFSIVSTLDATLSANLGVNNGVAIHVTRTDGTPNNPLASSIGYQQAWFEDINVCGDSQDEGAAVAKQGLWKKIFQLDYLWDPTFQNVNIACPAGSSPSDVETNYPGISAASRVAGTGTAMVEFNSCYDPQFLSNCKFSGLFAAGVHYHGTVSSPSIGQRMEGGSYILPEIANVLDCVVIDQSYNFAVTGNTTAGSATVTNVSPANIFGGWGITGPGIPLGTAASAYNSSANTITLSKPATATATGVSMTIVVEPSIMSDDMRVVGGQLSPRRHGIVFRQYQDAVVIGTFFMLNAAQWDSNEPLPAAIYCSTSSNIKSLGNNFGGGWVANLTPGPALAGSVGIRVDGASTCIESDNDRYDMNGLGMHVVTIPSAGAPTQSGPQRSVQLRSPAYGGRNGGSVTAFLPLYDPNGVVATDAISQTTTTDFFDIVSPVLGVANSPVHRNRRLRSDYAALTANVQLGSYSFSGLDSAGAEQTFSALTCIASSTSAGACRSALSLYAMVGGTLTDLLVVNGYTGQVEMPQASIAAVGFYGAPAVTTRPTITGSKGSNAGLASLISALVSLGLVQDQTTT